MDGQFGSIEEEGLAKVVASDECHAGSMPSAVQLHHRLQIPAIHCIAEDAPRPSFDSFRSSCPSTAPPTTPTATKLDEAHGRDTKLSSSGDVEPSSPPSDTPINTRPIPTRTTSEPSPTSENEGTLRRTGRRRARPLLGVSTFSPTKTHSVMLESGGLSPVVASPRSQKHHTNPGKANSEPSHTPIPNSTCFPSSSTSKPFPVDAEPISPDVTWELPSDLQEGERVYIPERTPTALVSPMGTTYISTGSVESGSEGHEQRLQYKPRKRIPTPRRRTTFPEPRPLAPPPQDTSALAESSSSGHAHDEGVNEMGEHVEKERRGSLSKWNFPKLIKRFSRTTLRTDISSSIEPSNASPTIESPILAAKVLTREGDGGKGYMSEGSARGKLGIASRLSRILPTKHSGSIVGFSHPTDSYTHMHHFPSVQTPTEVHPSPFTHGLSSTTSIGHGRGSTTELIPPVGGPRGANSRMSTVTVRSSDGWFSTVPVPVEHSSLPPSPNHFQTTFGPGHLQPNVGMENGSSNDVTKVGGRFASNPSKTSLLPPSAFTPPNSLPDELLKRHSISGSLASKSTRHPLSLSTDITPARSEESPIAPGSVRLLDVATAAALRRSIDFDDRVRRSEGFLKSAIYGDALSSSNTGSSLSFSSGGGRDASRGRLAKAARGRGRRSASLGVRGTNAEDGLTTGGGVFLPSTTEQPPRPPRHPQRSFHSSVSSSGYSTPGEGRVSFATVTRTDSGQGRWGSSLSAIPTPEETSNVEVVLVKETRVLETPKNTFSKRVGLGKRISRIFIGRG